jgi:catechol 2,3-dioxygenase-like lactoylglutathione lyase family enzyme
MPKLRHIAIAAEDPEKMADFYKKAFDFKEVGRPNGVLADGVFLSDGTLNMAILKFKTDQLGKGLDYRGIHHFGVLVEDVDEFSKRLESLGAEHYFDRNQVDPQAGYFEKKFYACCSTSPSTPGRAPNRSPPRSKRRQSSHKYHHFIPSYRRKAGIHSLPRRRPGTSACSGATMRS